MAEVINPAIVPKVTLPSGEQVPCVGMGPSVPTVYPPRMYLQLLQARSAVVTVCFDCAACYGNEHEIGQVF